MEEAGKTWIQKKTYLFKIKQKYFLAKFQYVILVSRLPYTNKTVIFNSFRNGSPERSTEEEASTGTPDVEIVSSASVEIAASVEITPTAFIIDNPQDLGKHLFRVLTSLCS